MADYNIRPAAVADAAGMVAVCAEIHPYLVRGEADTRRTIADPPAGEDRAAFVAELDGELAGWVSAYRDVRSAEAGFGKVSLLQVLPGARRKGIGGALLAAAAAHLRAAGIVRAGATATPDGLRFARRHGFEATRELRYSALDLTRFATPHPADPSSTTRRDAQPRSAGSGDARPGDAGPEDAQPGDARLGYPLSRDARPVSTRAGDLRSDGAPAVPVPPGAVRLVSLREVDAEEFYLADAAAAVDEPGDVVPQAPSFASWRYDIWDNPDLDHGLSTVAVVDGSIVSFSLLIRAGTRVWSDMTATVPEHRGRGLALQVKIEALRRAAAVGATTAFTANDESNTPMLAINTRLGYRPVATQYACVADL
ncbi:GNAT family N-acetyltransferase [Actinoplanes siamensis]|uniref:N-acetyltransferase domain-containing protein n=1 Tax=Actinoplanes siamensis TaxID=1223317 RepID=A0A919TP75_9ACTN|nr:GNAT family N-acetyltransferase [Actinoplanes siamensis]GIF09487.1 hypothetical protein Asi03nite_70250 [Actinoplanes siamensis]